jgi:YD repeat-containing protein
MVSVVTGSGLGLDQTSGYVLGSRGQLGSSVFRRFGESATVNAATGNLFVSRTDEILLGLGVDATVSRGYNSLGLSTDENGDNWQLGGQRRVAGLTGTVNTVGSTVTRYDWDGSSVVFTWDAAKSAYVSGKTGHQDDRLTFVSNVWTWVDSETRTSETYDHLNAGRLTAVKDADGNATSYSYTGVLLTRITTSGGEYTSLTWSGNNLTQLITTKSGGATLTRVRYTYDASNRLSTVLADLTPDDNTIADNAFVSTTYTYDGVSDRIASITQTGGAKLEFTYTQVGSDYRIATYKQTLANGVTSQVSLSYDTTSRVTTLTDQLGQVTKLTYDTSMRLTKIEQPPAQSGMTAQITTYTYDAAGNVLTAKDASNKTTTYQYDASGNLTLVRDAVGNTVTYTYGASNELLTETRYAVPDPDGAGVGLPSGSATTRYVYDAEYHLRYLISSDGRVTHHYYNWNGTLADTFTYTDRFYDLSSLTETQSPSETVMGDWVNAISDKARRFQVEYAYDFRGALTSVTTWPNSNAAGAGYGAATIVTYTYDQYGNLLTRQTGGVANTEVFTYDGLGRVTSSVDLNGATTSIAFTDSLNKQVVTLANGLVETSYYNFAGQLITNQTSASGLATANIYNRYDVLGRQRVATDALGNRSYMLYDALGRKVADIAADGAITEYAYDTSNRLSATISYATKITSWKLATLIDSNGNPVEMALSAVRPNSSADDVWEWRIYDNADRLAEVIDGGGGSTTFAYDGMSNLVKTTNYYNKLSAAQLALLKGKFSNRIYNASMDGSPGWETGYNPAAIVDAGSPYTGTYGTYSYVKSNFTATAAGQVASIATDASHWFTVAAGEQLTVQAGLEGIGNVQSLQLVVQWHDASGAALPMTSLGTLSGATGYNTRLSGTVTVPTGAVTGRLEVYMTSSASGTGSFSLIDPVVLPAVNGQAPLSVTTPSAYGAKDEVSRNFYDRDGNLVGALDGLGYLSQIIYDGAGRVVHTVAYANATSSTLRASGSFADLLASVGTSGSDIHTYKVYYNDGRLRYALDANLRPTEYVYDAAGNVLHTFDYGASIAAGSSYEATYVAGQISSLGLANNTATRKTWAVYDNAGRLAFAINAEGGVTGYSYNVQGQVAKTVQYATSRATTSDPTLTTMNSWSDTNTNANDRVIRSYYDKRGDLRYIVDAAGYVTRNAYDLNGHLLNTARYDAVYAASDTTTFEILEAATKGTYVGASYTYDALERLVTTTDALGVITRLAYDALDRVTDRTIAYGTGSATTTHYIYDAAGNVTDETASWGTADASTTHYTYDGFGNVLTRTSAYGASEASTMAFAYDQLGQLVTQVAANGTSVAATTSFAYDSFGNVIATTDSRGNVSYSTYDKLNRLIWKVDAERYVTQTTYTIGNEVASVTRYAARSTASGAGAVPTVVSTTGVDATTTFMRDKLGRVTRTTDAMGAYEEYTVDAFGNRQTVRNKLGGLTTNTFDKRGLLVSEAMLISPLDSNGNPIAGTGTLIENRFEYDSRGNRTKMIEAFGLPEARTTVYTYDKANRLTGKISGFVSTLNPDTMAISTGISVAEYYTYDVRGNLIQTKDPLGNRTLSYYDANDRKIAEIDPRGKLTRWTYDRDGNVKSIRVYGDLISVPANPGGAVPSSSNTNYREILYDYDRNGRLTKTTTGSVETFTFSSGSVIVAPIISSNAYDAAGNIVLQTDGRQNNIFNFYDKNGRKIGQVDAEKFVTSYTYDAEGNVLSETRFGTRLTLSVSSATNFSSVLAAQATSIDDRTTVFTYDRNGRRLTEKRLGVVAYSVNASGDLVSSADFSLISYTYNALGLVTSKKEAAESENQADGKTLYDYDSFGRQIKITGVKYKDFTGNDVRNVKTVSYDGLNNIIANVENGVRTTTYVYGPAGRLASVTDGANNTTKYFYDVLGRITATTYKLIRADSADQYVSQSLRYDAAGNQISQKTFSSADQAVWSQSGDMTDLFYNAYGEVVARGTNSNGDAGKAREFNEYDKAGRIWRTNFNDGVTKAYGYDANGNATLLMQSMGTTELKTIGSIGAMIADTGVSKTFSEYDARNQLTRTIQSSATNSGLSPIHAEKVSVDGSSTPINFQNTAVVDPWNRVNLDSSTSTINSTTSISSITTSGGAATIRFDNTPPDANVMKVFGRIQGSSGTFVLLGTATKTGTTSFSFSAPELSTQNMELRYFAFNAGGATVDARRVDYVRNAYGRIDPTTATSDPSNGFSYDAASKTMDIQFVGYQGITYGQLFIRPIGSSDFAYQKNLGVSGEWTGRVGGQVYRNYATVGIGDIDFKSPTYGTTSFEWQILYYTSSGSMVKTQTGLISGTPIGQASVNSSPLALNGGGQAMAISDGGAYKILFSGFPSNTANLRAYYRLAGSTNSFQEMAVSGGAYGQWFGSAPSDGQSYEFWVEPTTSGGGLAGGSRSYGTFVAGSGFAISLTKYQQVLAKIQFQAASGSPVTRQQVRYSTNGGSTWSAWNSTEGGGYKDLDLSAVASNFYSTTNILFEYETFNGSQLISHTSGNAAIGYDNQHVWNIQNSTIMLAKVAFNPLQSSGTQMKLYYRLHGTMGNFSTAVLNKQAGSNAYIWDVEGIRPISGQAQYDYYYDIYDNAGNLLPNLTYADHVSGEIILYHDQYINSNAYEIRWKVDVASASQFLIDRKQEHDAFGEISSETDGRGNKTLLSYNTMGKLVKKKSPQVSITGETGVDSVVNPTENYYYDLSGRQVGQSDANGNVTRQILLAGTGYGGSTAIVLEEYLPGASTTYGYDIFGDQRKVTQWINRSTNSGVVTTKSYDASHNLIQIDHPARAGGGNSPANTQLSDYYSYDAIGQRIKHWNSQLGENSSELTDHDVMGRITRTTTMSGQYVTYGYTYQLFGIATNGLGDFGGWVTYTWNSSQHQSFDFVDIFGRTSYKDGLHEGGDVNKVRTNFTYDKAGKLVLQTNTRGQNTSFTYYENG